MIEQQAQVVRVEDDQVSVRVGAGSGCSACDAGKGCGAGVFGKLLKRRPVTLSFVNDCNARVGQVVKVGISEIVFMRLVYRFYGLPLLAGLAGAVFGHQIGVVKGVGAGLIDALTLTVALVVAALFIWTGRQKGVSGLSAQNIKLLGPVDDSSGTTCPAEVSLDK